MLSMLLRKGVINNVSIKRSTFINTVFSVSAHHCAKRCNVQALFWSGTCPSFPSPTLHGEYLCKHKQ